MRIFHLLILLFCCTGMAHAQKKKADSLLLLSAREKVDTNKVTQLWQAASNMYSYAPDSTILIAQKALLLAKNIKYEEGESRSLGQMANGFLSIGNYPNALEYYIKKLKIEEKRSNPYNLASVIMNIGIVYVYQEEYEKALYYLNKADSIIGANNITGLQYNIKINLGDAYEKMNQVDSGFLYFNQALKIAMPLNDPNLIGSAMVGLGHVYLKAGNHQRSLQEYTTSISFLTAADNEDLLCEAMLGLAKLYQATGNKDSAVIFANKCFALAEKDGFQSRQLDAAIFLTTIYSHQQNKDSAFVYLQKEKVIGDSIYSKDKIRASQMITINEQLRQAEISENIRKQQQERSQQLQLLLIGLCIPALFLITLLLSKVKVHVRIVEFAGILSLLILFEYLTLLLHPVVVEFTHHTPFYELLIFVAIASLIIPAHHRIEHWLVKKLTVRKTETLKIKKQRFTMKKPS